MLELIAQGTTVDSRWRRLLPEKTVEIGRATDSYRVPWDGQISRRHVMLTANQDQVQVEKIPEAANPVFFGGDATDRFVLKPGEHFVIGKTTFTLAADRAFVSLNVPDPISQRTFSPEYLRKLPYQDADRRIDVLNRIPEVISSAGDVQDLLTRMVNTLMAGIPSAATIGIVELSDRGTKESPTNHPAPKLNQTVVAPASASRPSNDDAIEIIQWDRRGLDSGDFQPSETLIRQSIERNETILHIWNPRKRLPAEYTFDYENDWAFACPISSAASPGWGIYVAGSNAAGSSSVDSGSEEVDLQGDIKFCELVGATLKNLLMVKQLERQQSSLRAFFSPIVTKAISGRDPDVVLAPRKCEVSVLFCDLRGFAKRSEQMADQLLELLDRVSDSLGIMTRKILDHGGVIGDFHGDSAMGFWGWPLEPGPKSENAVSAISAALDIRDEVAENLRYDDHLHNFQIGMGIASGEAVVGKIGTEDQVKVTAFGPVVNLASRLEGMTRWLNSCILTERDTVDRLSSLTADATRPMTRCLGTFQPFGMEGSVDVYQVFADGELAEPEIENYAQALEYFRSGRWPEARRQLAELPTEDSARKFMASFLTQHQDTPPPDWRGIIRMQAK